MGDSPWWAVLLSLFVPAACAAQEGMLVSPEWLAEHLGDGSLVILHVGSRQDYDAAHIPGARLLTLGDVSVTGERGLRLELPPVRALEEAFGRVGIADASRVIVCAGNGSAQSATRVWFTLDYLGWGGRVSLLDGGLALWRAQNRPLSTDTPRTELQRFTARPRPEAVVDAGWLLAHLEDPSVIVLDARLPQFFAGADAGGMPRAGHIPGARNIPFSSLFDESRRLKPEKALRELLSAAGAGPGKQLVSYCHIGQQATVLYFVARYLGMDVHLYDGSFQDWSSRPELPVESK